MDSKGCPKCPHGEFLIKCRICNGGEICIHGRLFSLCAPCTEVRQYIKD